MLPAFTPEHPVELASATPNNRANRIKVSTPGIEAVNFANNQAGVELPRDYDLPDGALSTSNLDVGRARFDV
jgi:hypothetical protein